MLKQLSQDLPENLNVNDIDILGDDTTEETTDITQEVVEDNTVADIAEPDTTEVKEEGEDDFDEASYLKDILGDAEEIKQDIDETGSDADEMKNTIEEAKVAIQEDDKDSAEKLIDDLYGQVIDYSTKIDTLSTKNDILQNKLIELTKSNTDYELQIAQNSGKSNDPKMIILNRMYDGAKSGDEFSKNKVLTTLEDMYYTLAGKSFDDTRVEKISNSNAGGVILNELTAPAIEEKKEKEVDLNDITSIF